MKSLKRILAIGAHPDDIELGCGGSVAKFTAQGIRVCAVVLSHGKEGNRLGLDRVSETHRALSHLGVMSRDIHQYDFPDTKLYEHESKIICTLEKHARDFDPERVYTMFQHDRHQDHRTTFQASVVACRSARQVLCYETPSSWVNFQPEVFEDINGHLNRKIEALALHESQRDRQYTQPEAMRINAASHGNRVGVGFAEAFIGYKFVL